MATQNQSTTPLGPLRPPNGDRTQVIGDFELLDRIGQGAVGAVFKARQRSMDRVVAVKILKPSLSSDATYVDRFWREARAAARLSHPNIVLAIDAGEDRGFYYFAMEYVEGHTVGLLLKAGPLEERRALEIALQVARALDYAWSEERIVHRDIKPGNIIITPDGAAKLADLGLAHEADLGEEDSLAEDGKIVGTPFYIAPEQILRRPDLDVRCDLYALGASLFHMVTGKPPFAGGDTKSVLARHLHEPAPDPRQVRPDLSAETARIITRLMAKDRDERYPDAKGLVADIEAALGKGRPAARAADAAALPRPRRIVVRRRRSSVSQMVVICLVLMAFGIATLVVVTRAARRAEEPQGVAAGPDLTAAERAYEEAMAFAEANPSDLAGGIERLAAVEISCRGTTFESLAAQRRAQLEGELEQGGKEALRTLTRRAEELVAAGDYTSAPAVFDRFPRGLSTKKWLQEIAAARATVEREARMGFTAALAHGDEAADKGDLAGALQAYQAIAGSLPAAWKDEVAARIAATQRRQQQGLDRQRAEKEAEHFRLMGRLAACYRARQYDEAESLAKASLAAALPEFRPEIERELDEIGRLRAFWTAVEQGAAALVGQPYSVRGITGKLVAVRAGQLIVQTPGGSFAEEIRSMRKDEALRLALAALPKDQAALGAVRFLAAEGDMEGAEDRLKALEGAGVDVAPLRARIQRLGHTDALTAARAELDGVRAAMEAGKADEGKAALRKFLDRYDGLPAAAGLCAEARKLLDETAAPQTEGTMPARIRFACEGTCTLLLNGKAVGKGSYQPGRFEEVDLKVSPGDVLAVDAESQSATRALYLVLATQDGRYVLPTDRSWFVRPDAVDGWDTAAEAPGKWQAARPAYWPHVKPGYAAAGQDLPGYWIWGEGERCLFRKVIRFAGTVKERAGEERERQQALTAKHGAARKATLWIACQDAYHLYQNGRLAGCAASFVAEGASYTLQVRNGDILGVQAMRSGQTGWLQARLEAEGGTPAILTDRTWVYTLKAVEGWSERGGPQGFWMAPDFVDKATQRIWGKGESLFFRKTIDLAPRDNQGPRSDLQGRVRQLDRGRVEVLYDFRDPVQLADWYTDGAWAWAKGAVAGTQGSFYTEPYQVRQIEVEARVESPGDFLIALWGSDVTRFGGYSVSFAGTHRGAVSLWRGNHILGSARLPGGPALRRIVLRKEGNDFHIDVDGKEVLAATDDEPLDDGSLSRVGFRSAGRGATIITSCRITETAWDRGNWPRRRRP